MRQMCLIGIFVAICSHANAASVVPLVETNDSVEADRTSDLHEVVVTATGTRHLLKDVPVHTEVISRKMLDAYGGKSIEDILGALTASFAFNEGDMGSQMQLGGLGNNYILILLDGKRLHGDNGGENDLGLIDPHNIERIEIVKGAQSALYGSDAMAGVVNIITKRHDKESIFVENTTRGAAGGGLHGDIRQHNGFGFQIGKVQSYTNFQLQYSDGWQNTTNEYAEAQVITNSKNKTANKFRNWQVSERITYRPLKNLEFYADGSYYTKDIWRPHDKQRASIVQNPYDLMYRNAGVSGGGKWTFSNAQSSGNYVSLDVDWNKHEYSYNYTDRFYDDIAFKGEIIHDFPYYAGDRSLQSDQQRIVADAKGVFYLPASNTLSGGLEYRYDYLRAPLRVKGATANDWTGAVYVQDEFNLIPWLNLTAGVRLVNNGAFGFRATPKASAMFSLGDFRIRAGWSQGFKTPTPKELHYHYVRSMGSSTFYYMGNEKLGPQTSNYYNVGAEYRGKKFTVSVMGYYNQLDNMITLVNVPMSEIPVGEMDYMGDGSISIVPRRYMNMDKAKTYGVDFSITYNINKDWTLGGNYSYLNTDAEVYDSEKKKMHKVTIDGMAHHKWNAYATWNHRLSASYQFGVGLYTRGSSERFYQNDGNGKPFQIWKITTNHSFGKKDAPLTYRLELGVDNLLNYVDRTMRPYHLGTNICGTTIYATFNITFRQGKKIKTTIKKITNHEDD